MKLGVVRETFKGESRVIASPEEVEKWVAAGYQVWVEVWQSKTVVVFKRGMATGYAGVATPLFLKKTPACASATLSTRSNKCSGLWTKSSIALIGRR